MPHAPPGFLASTNERRPLMISFAGRRKPSFSRCFTAHHFEPRSETRTKIERRARKRYEGWGPAASSLCFEPVVEPVGGVLPASFAGGGVEGFPSAGASDVSIR